MVDGPVHSEPVFVDRSGRRRQLFTVIGAGIGVALLVSLGIIIAGLLGASPVHVPGLPGSGGVAAQPGVSGSDAAGDPSAAASASGTRRPGTTLAPTATGVLTNPTPTSPRRTGVPTDKPRPTRSH